MIENYSYISKYVNNLSILEFCTRKQEEMQRMTE